MFESHERIFVFSPKEIGRINFYDAHVPWDIKSIPMTRTHIPKLFELLKEKIAWQYSIYSLVQKIYLCMRTRVSWQLPIYSSVALCCKFVIYHIYSTILEYIGSYLRSMLKYVCSISSMTLYQTFSYIWCCIPLYMLQDEKLISTYYANISLGRSKVATS